jgi:hypothetical protein
VILDSNTGKIKSIGTGHLLGYYVNFLRGMVQERGLWSRGSLQRGNHRHAETLW